MLNLPARVLTTALALSFFATQARAQTQTTTEPRTPQPSPTVPPVLKYKAMDPNKKVFEMPIDTRMTAIKDIVLEANKSFLQLETSITGVKIYLFVEKSAQTRTIPAGAQLLSGLFDSGGSFDPNSWYKNDFSVKTASGNWKAFFRAISVFLIPAPSAVALFANYFTLEVPESTIIR